MPLAKTKASSGAARQILNILEEGPRLRVCPCCCGDRPVSTRFGLAGRPAAVEFAGDAAGGENEGICRPRSSSQEEKILPLMPV